MKENIKALRHWPLWGEFTGYRWIPRTKGQWRGKCFHVTILFAVRLYKLHIIAKTFFAYRIKRTKGSMSSRGIKGSRKHEINDLVWQSRRKLCNSPCRACMWKHIASQGEIMISKITWDRVTEFHVGVFFAIPRAVWIHNNMLNRQIMVIIFHCWAPFY